MKLNPHSTLPLISRHEVVHPTEVTREIYDHPWDKHIRKLDKDKLNKPNPPSQQDVEKARFVDKTYHWTGGSSSVRSREQRTDK